MLETSYKQIRLEFISDISFITKYEKHFNLFFISSHLMFLNIYIEV